MSRESTREYYRRKAQEEREGKNDSAQSTTSSTREYYRKKAQEERETRKPDTNTVSGGASGSGPVVNNSTTTKPNLPAKPAKPVEPSEPTVNTPVQDTVRNSATVQYEIDELSKQRTELERERSALLSTRKTAMSPRVQELGTQIKEVRDQLDALKAEAEKLKQSEQQALIDSGEYRDASFLDYTWNALKQGWYNSMYGAESFHEMMGADNEKQKYEDILAGEDYKFIPSNGFEEAISGAANLLGQQARQWTHPRSLAAGGAAAAATAIAGQVGPQVLAPEEVITVPAAFMAGIAAGSTTSNFEIEAGFAYNEMLEQGISPETAKKVAVAVGGVNAALEMVQADELIKSFKVLKGSKATQGVASRIAQELLDRGIDVAKETAQEVAQEGATIAGTQIGSKIDKGEWAYSAGDVVDRLGDTAKSSALSFGVMNVPGGTYNTYNILRDQQNQQAQQTAPVQQEAQVQNDPEAAIEEAAIELVRREEEQAARETEIAPQERVSREDVSVPNRSENVAPSSNLEAAAMEMAQEEMRRVQRAENLLNNPGYGEHGTSAFREIVEESGRDPGEVRTEFQTAYEAGRTGLPRTHISVLNPVQATAFNAGQQDLIADQARDNANQAKGVKVSGKAGFDSTGVPKDVTKAEVEVLDRLFKMVGVHGHMAGNQSYNAKLTGTTDVAIANDFQREVYDSKGNVVRTFTIVDHGVHEAGLHQAMKLAPVQMRAFINDFYNYLGKGTTPTVGTLAEQKQAKYGEQDVSLTLDKAMEEVTANEVFSTLYGSSLEELSAGLDRVMNGKNEDAKKGARTFLDVLSDLWKKVKAIAAQLRGKGDVKTAREVEQTADAVKELRDKYEAALKVAVENAAKAEKNTAQQDGGNMQFSLKYTKDGRKYVEIDIDQHLFEGLTTKQMQDKARNIIKQRFKGKVIGTHYTAYVDKTGAEHFSYPASRRMDEGIKRDKMRTSPELDTLIEASVYRDNVVPEDGKHPDAVGGLDKLDVMYLVNGRAYKAEITVKVTARGRLFYDMTKIEDITSREIGQIPGLGTAETANNVSGGRVAQQEGNVNSEADEQFSLVEDAATLEFLNNQKLVKVYRAMQEIDGKLYPPMAALVKGETGKKQLVEDTRKGEWYQADERPDLIKLDKNGKPKFELNKGNGGMVPAAYNPYFHTSASPLNDQFSSAYDRPNIVVVEGYIPSSELTSGYKAQYAKDSVGETAWHAGPVASKLKGEKARRVFLSRWFKAERVVPVDEVARIVAKTLDGENVSVPWNVVTPSLRKALEAEGVDIDYKDVKMGNKVVTFESTQFSLKDEGDIQTATNKAGDVVAETHKDGSTMFSLKTYEEDGRAYLRSWLDKKVKSKAITREEADDITRQMDEFYDICQKFTDKYAPFGAWSEAEVVKGKDGKPAFSVVKANGDYAMNLDFSLVCKKRRTLDAVFREMINRGVMDDVELGEEQIAKINAIIRDSGFETACALCFVDSKRYRQAMVADNFVNMYNELVEMLVPEGSDIQAHHFDFLKRGLKDGGRALHDVPDSELGKGIVKLKKVMQEEPSNRTVRYKTASHLLHNPKDRRLVMRSEFMNTDGFEAVTVANRKVLGLYNSSKGSGGPKASLSDVQYLGDILKKSNFTPARAYAVGGVRIQSFSDYVSRLVFDYLQMIADLAAKKLPAHAYTKEEMFALQFGMTGVKINLSLVPAVDPKGVAPGLDADGNYVWYDGQSFGSDVTVKGSGQTGFQRAVEIQNAAGYSANCGTIAVGISDEHIWKMLGDDDIRMVIPYHKSSLNHIVAVLNNIDKYTDYTGVQNTRYKATGSKIDGKDFNFNEALRRLGDAKAAANEYLEWCEKNGYLPKFDTFAGHENYYKLLEDFSTYDNGVAAPQGAVTMTFPKEGDAFGSMAQLIEQGLEEDAELEGRRQSDVPAIVDKIEAVYREGGMEKGAQFSLKEQGDLMRENAKLKEVNQALQEQLQVTKFAKVDKKSLDRFAKQLLKDYSSDADMDDIRSSLDSLYTYLANGEDGQAPGWEQAYRMAYETAQSVLESASEVNDELYTQYKSLRNRLRNTAIRLDRSYEHDMGGYESLEEFRRANFGRIKLTNDGIPVDTLYHELAATYPELFDESEHNHPGDQLAHIAEVLADLQPYEWNPYGRNMREAATWLANDIMERFFELPQAKPTFADKAERKLTEQAIKDAKKLENLRTKKNERIAQLIQEGREKVKTVQAKERTKRQEAVKEVKEHYKAKEKKMSESRKASVLRAKIERHAGELKEKLLRPTDKKHIPQELQGAVAKLLESINMESGYDMVYGKDGKYHRVERGTELGAETTKRTQAFAELQSVYAQLANELTIDPDLMGEDGLLNDVIKLADKPLANMSSGELQTVWEALRGIEATVLTANRMHAEGRWTVVSEAAEALREDNTGKKDKTELRGILGKGQKLVGLDMETPETFFHLLGDAGDAVFRMMRNSQDEHIRLMKEVAAFTKRELKDANVRKLERELHTVTLGGEDVKLTTAQIMELYVLMHREQALDHIFVGGILPDVVSTRGIKKVSKAEPVRGISLEEVSKAVKVLTPEQKAIAEKLQKYASTKLSEYGNAAAMKVYGYEKFGEKNYWPIRSNRQEIKKDVQTDTATVTLANRGFTKGTKPHANNSVRLGSIFDTFSTHASEMATYAAWLGTLEDVNRLRNYKFREDDAVIGTVSGIIDRVHGTQGSDYLAKLLNDVTNGVKGTHGETAYMSGLVGNFKAASVGANLRVIIQQPTSILRAMDMIGAHYLAVPGNPLNGWKKALKYAPIAQWKDWGYFDINTGRQMKDVLFDSDSAVDKVKSISMWGAGAMDSVAWGQLWNAVEAEVKAKRKELKPDTEEFYKAVAERFTEVVDHTQVVDGILQRSQIMRSADGLTKMATAFMGEPTKQYNMMMQAAYDAKNGKGNLRKAAMKKLARTAAALAIAGVVNSMAQSVMDAVRDDDKEEEWWEKWLAAFKSNLGSTFNPVSYIPFAKDVLSILEGYDVSRMDMESVEKLVSAGQNMIKALNGTGKHTVGAAAINLIAEIARLVGIPVSNLKREITSFSMLAAVETDNYVLQYRMEKWLKNLNYSGNSGTFMDILYNAYVNDKEAYELIYNDMVASGYDADKLASGMESRMKKAQGVTKVDEMEQRYLSPSEQTKYDNALKSVQGSSVWKRANEEQRDGLEDDLYGLITQNSDGKKLQEDISEAAAYGVSESEYLLWQLALDMNNMDGKGGYNTSEKAGAITSMTELSDFEKAYLWGTMTTSTEVFDAYDAGVDMDAYFGFKAGVSELEAGVDYKKGDTASRQAAIRMLLDSLGIDSDDRNWLYHTEYKK